MTQNDRNNDENLLGVEGSAELEQQSVLTELNSLIDSHLREPNKSSLRVFEAVQEASMGMDRHAVLPERIQLLLKIAISLYHGGEALRSALSMAEDAVTLARRLDDVALLRRTLSFCSTVLAETGNFGKSFEYLAEALVAARMLEDPIYEAGVWGNIGVSFNAVGLFRDAAAAHEMSLALARGHARVAEVECVSLANLASTTLQMGQYGRSISASKRVLEGLGKPSEPAQHLAYALAANTLVRALIEIEDHQESRRMVSKVRFHADASNSARAEIAALVSEGMVDVIRGMKEFGFDKLNRALDRARTVPAALRDALSAIASAHLWVGDQQSALAYHKELLHSIKRTRTEAANFHEQQHLQKLAASNEEDVTSTMALELRHAIITGENEHRALINQRTSMLLSMAVTAELRVDGGGDHPYRVGRLAALLAKAAGCDENTQFEIDLLARLHDIGKLALPDSVLNKQEQLSGADRVVMESHARVGAEILSTGDIPELEMAARIAKHHHERWDGKGYPDKLSGEAIPFEARVTALAEVFDALTHHRHHRQAWSTRDALAHIASQKGKQFDPTLTDIFVKLIRDLQSTHEDLDVFLAEGARDSRLLIAHKEITRALQEGLAPPK
jgi:putative two-component system response regulator